MNDTTKYDFQGIHFSKAQVEAIDFAMSTLNCILALKPGMGKTLLSLRIAYEIMSKKPAYTCVIACPKEANSAFKKELKKLNLPFSMYTTDEFFTTPNSKFIIYNYSNLKLMKDTLKTDKVFLLADEVHCLSNPQTNVYKTLRKYRRDGKFACVIGLTGTPLLNSLDSLWYVVDFVKPGFLGSHSNFCNQYIVKKEYNFPNKSKYAVARTYKTVMKAIGFKNLEILRTVLQGVCFVRGKSYDINYIHKSTLLSPDDEKDYALASKGVFESTTEKDFSARLHDLQRVVDGAYSQSPNKAKLLVQTLKDIVAKGEGALVFMEYEDTYNFLGDYLSKYKKEIGFNNLYFITGKTPYKDRLMCEASLAAKDIVLITQAGCRSINLQAVNNVIFYDTPFSVQNFIQCCTGDTHILTDKGFKRVKDLSNNFNVEVQGKVYPAHILGKKFSDILKVKVGAIITKVSPDHKFRRKDKFIRADELKKGDILDCYHHLSKTITDEMVESVEQVSQDFVYIIQVDSPEHVYISNNLVSHNCVGRVTRVDTKYDKQFIYFLSIKDTIDDYKYYLIKNHIVTLNAVLGDDPNLPYVEDYDILQNKDKLKNTLLWKKGKTYHGK